MILAMWDRLIAVLGRLVVTLDRRCSIAAFRNRMLERSDMILVDLGQDFGLVMMLETPDWTFVIWVISDRMLVVLDRAVVIFGDSGIGVWFF